MRRADWAAAAVALLTAGTVRADDLLAIRPGVMCVSPDALAKLILHNGDSRTHAPVPRPQDLAVAAGGGCIDIPPGARVMVQQAFNNTSIVTYDGPGAPPGGRMIVPNVDFAPATGSGTLAPTSPAPSVTAPTITPPTITPPSVTPPTITAPTITAPTITAPPITAPPITAPPGYAVARRLSIGPDGAVLVLLQDRRLTPAISAKLWGRGGPENALAPNDPLLAELNRKPLLNAQLLYLSGPGQVVARRLLDTPLARLRPAPQRGLPSPAFLLTVDHGAGTSGSDAPGADLPAPSGHSLAPAATDPAR